MSETNSNDASRSVLQTIVRQSRLLRLQRIAMLLLLGALVFSIGFGQAEHRRTLKWRALATEMLTSKTNDSTMEFTKRPAAYNSESAFYPAALIGEDGSKTPLNGKALQVDLGNRRILEVRLDRRPQDQLFIWAPAKRSDDFFNCLDIHPTCCNGMLLELEQHKMRSASTENADYAVKYDSETTR